MPEQMSADPFFPFESPHIGVTYQGYIAFILDPHYPNNGIILQVAPEFNPIVNLPLQFFNRHIWFTPSVRRYDAFVSRCAVIDDFMYLAKMALRTRNDHLQKFCRKYRLSTGGYTVSGYFALLLCITNQQQQKTKVMKKLIAIAAIFFAFTTAAMAQTKTFYSTAVYTAVYNSYTGKYEWTSPRTLHLRISVASGVISIENQAHSTFYLGNETINQWNNDGTHTYQWDAADQNGTACTVKITAYADGSELLVVFYSDVAASYSLPI
jgi:hypothetical protein